MSINLVKLIQNMYEKTNCSIKLKHGRSRSFRTDRGVQQGCILSPRLFNIFINDIPPIFGTDCEPLKLGDEMLNCLMYAEDLVILSESATGMQNCLDKLKEYTIEWGLNINRAKTKILIFQRGGLRPKLTFEFGN